jgi:hypothetical protein
MIDLNDPSYLEDEIERRGLQKYYVFVLGKIVSFSWLDLIGTGCRHRRAIDDVLWKIVRATPEQRCRAALQVLQDENAHAYVKHGPPWWH